MENQFNVVLVASVLAGNHGHYWANAGFRNLEEAGLQLPDPRQDLKTWCERFEAQVRLANNILGLRGQFDWGVMPEAGGYGLSHTTGSGRLSWSVYRHNYSGDMLDTEVTVHLQVHRPEDVGSIEVTLDLGGPASFVVRNKDVRGEVCERHWQTINEVAASLFGLVVNNAEVPYQLIAIEQTENYGQPVFKAGWYTHANVRVPIETNGWPNSEEVAVGQTMYSSSGELVGVRTRENPTSDASPWNEIFLGEPGWEDVSQVKNPSRTYA